MAWKILRSAINLAWKILRDAFNVACENSGYGKLHCMGYVSEYMGLYCVQKDRCMVGERATCGGPMVGSFIQALRFRQKKLKALPKTPTIMMKPK